MVYSNNAVCTIVSKNYFAYARTLYNSIICHNPDLQFVVLLVDENDDVLDLAQEPFLVLEVSNLNIPNFKQAAFKFDIIELNTNVKPSFLKYLLKNMGFLKVLYLDPDILLYHALSEVLDCLSISNIVLTPHCTSPINDDLKPTEQDFLQSGTFNLGFIGLSNSQETIRFLDWWEQRCLTLGFVELQTGLFVDQKWVNLVPCFFEGVLILKHLGYNMAYWNLHERVIKCVDGQWIVNDKWPLVFFHFSGIVFNDQTQISHHQTRFNFSLRPDLLIIFREYHDLLSENGLEACLNYSYKYSKFSNSVTITHLARRMYSVNEGLFQETNPFDSEGLIYTWCKNEGYLSSNNDYSKFLSETYCGSDIRIRMINFLLRVILKVFGSNRYTLLMKYCSYISVLRNQEFKKEILFKNTSH
ncbi:MAG: group 1 glycosyl transferase [Geobacteraceae bacterium]|nr:group 1 glycosyl transferase [Geobacteraceae bacterium]